MRNSSNFGGNFSSWKKYPKFREFPQIWGNFVSQKHVLTNHFYFKCLVWIWKYYKIFFSYWSTSMNYYSIFRTLFPIQKQDWKMAISPNLGESPNFEIFNFSKFGGILQIWVFPDCIMTLQKTLFESGKMANRCPKGVHF